MSQLDKHLSGLEIADPHLRARHGLGGLLRSLLALVLVSVQGKGWIPRKWSC